MKVEVILPFFHGFYNSIHDDKLNDLAQDEDGDWCEEEAEKIDWQKARIEYCKEYVDKFSELTEIAMEFKELDSPRFYNYSTDKIVVEISLSVLADIYAKTIKNYCDELSDKIEENHSHRSGFISFYSNDIEHWIKKGIVNYDHNEWSTILEVYCEEHTDHDADSQSEIASEIEVYSFDCWI